VEQPARPDDAGGDPVEDRLLGAAEAAAGRRQFLEEAGESRRSIGEAVVRLFDATGNRLGSRRREVGP
jgi:hypothetical protein